MDRLSRQVVAQVQEMISRGDLRAGDRLPTERQLAEDLGVGRNSVREAIRELDALGLIESRRGEGTYVREFDAAALMAPFRSVIALSTTAPTAILEFRATLEPEVAALAAQKLSEEGGALLANALEQFERAVSEGRSAVDADTSFHLAVARAAGNPALVAVHEALLELLADFRYRLDRKSYRPSAPTLVDHRKILEAILERDPERARAATREHLRHVGEALRGEQRRSAPRGRPGPS